MSEMPTCGLCVATRTMQPTQLCRDLIAKGVCLLIVWQQDQARQAVLSVIIKGLEAGARPAELAQLISKGL